MDQDLKPQQPVQLNDSQIQQSHIVVPPNKMSLALKGNHKMVMPRGVKLARLSIIFSSFLVAFNLLACLLVFLEAVFFVTSASAQQGVSLAFVIILWPILLMFAIFAIIFRITAQVCMKKANTAVLLQKKLNITGWILIAGWFIPLIIVIYGIFN